MGDSERLLKAVDLLYGSVLDDALWPQAMHSLGEYAGARGTSYLIANHKVGAIVHSESQGVDPEAESLYTQYYGHVERELRLVPALTFPVGQGFTESMLLDTRRLKKSEIFCELLAPYDIPYIVGTWVTRRALTASAFIFERSFSQGPAEREDVARCAVLIPHLVRALHAREALAGARQLHRIHLDLLDRLPFGTILLDASMRVAETSAMARALFSEKQSLIFSNGHVRAALLEDDRRLQRAIHLVTYAGRDRVVAGHSVTVRRKDNRATLHVYVLPVRASHALAGARAACMLFVFNPETDVRPTAAFIRTALDLTDAEARLASALFTGVTLREAADRLQLSINTCKSQLKSVYAKTGCRSHVEIAKAILMSGAFLPGLAGAEDG